jgi:hypothetical protein
MGATGIRTGITIGTATDAQGNQRARPGRLVALVFFLEPPFSGTACRRSRRFENVSAPTHLSRGRSAWRDCAQMSPKQLQIVRSNLSKINDSGKLVAWYQRIAERLDTWQIREASAAAQPPGRNARQPSNRQSRTPYRCWGAEKPSQECAGDKQHSASGEPFAAPTVESNQPITEPEVEKVEEPSRLRTPVIYEVVRRVGEEEMLRPAVSRGGPEWQPGSFSLLSQAILL